jgi:NAD-dependent isocitrate dehydrogenase
MNKQTVTLIKGDGIGPEIAHAVQTIFSAANVPITWEEADAGLYCIEKYGNGIPQETLDSIIRNKVALKAPTTTPIGGGHKSINVTIRKSLDLFANVRPSKSLPGIKTRFDNVDLIIVRENLEDTYGGIEHMQTPEVAQCLRLITRSGSRNAARYAFEMAKLSGRKRVTCVHKANIQKITDGLFLRSFEEVAADYPHIQHDDILIDNLCMQLVTKPEQFDVLLLPNLFGDIASDLCAGLVGGLGVAPGGNIGQDSAVFEAVHGSAPDIAGKGLANPTAILLSGLQMLRYLGLNGYAQRIENALQETLQAGIKTGDLGGKATTQEFTDAICSRIAPEDSVSGQETPTKIIIAREPLTKEQQDWNIHGIDVFVRSKNGGIPALPETIGSFKLAMISNRGTKIYPGNAPDILLVDHFRCRFYADKPVQHEDVITLLTAFPKEYPWMHVEILHKEGDNMLFSKAQGE